MAVCHATITITFYLLMVKKFTITARKDSELTRSYGHKVYKVYYLFYVNIIIVMAPKTTTTGLLTTTFVK